MGKELFDNRPTKVADLLSDVKNGKIGLPDLQRPFVWKDKKARDLLDSMLKGYPIGYIMLWESPNDFENKKAIGIDDKIYKTPKSLVIDGQQRLTALLAALYGSIIKDKNFKERKIRISYNPLERKFEVWNQAYDRSPEWISEISEIFIADQNHQIPSLRKSYIKNVNESRRKNEKSELTDEQETEIEKNLNDLLDLGIYLLPTMEINSKADEEDVADIFVRVNSGGQKLSEKNFIETLLAVYDNDVYDKINKFCSESRVPKDGTSYNQIINVDPAHLIRVSVGIGFKRARLRYAYMLLRGKDLKTGEFSQVTREENLKIFKDSLDKVVDLNTWHSFLNLFPAAGYLNGSMVKSSNAIVFSYVLYLIGKLEYNVSAVELRRIITKWIFFSTITGFYTGSTESEVEKQFGDLRSVHTADEFVAYLNSSISSKFTNDYFEKTLPGELNSSALVSTTWYGYLAAINVLGTPMLFSSTQQALFFTLGTSGKKKSIDNHHIFPKNYLSKIGITENRDRNQLANFTYLDYVTNINIADKPPIEYVGEYRNKMGEEAYRLSCEQNALPENFETMEYPEFLAKRRFLMAKLIQKAYNKLCQ